MKILKDSALYLAGEILAKALPFLLLPYLSRKLGVAGFGELAFWQTVTAALLIVFGFSQDGAVARYYHVYGHRNLATLIRVAYGYTLMTTALGLLVALACSSLLLAAAVLAAAGQAMLATQLSLRQSQKQAAAYTLIHIGSGLFTSLLTVWLLEATHGQPVLMRMAAIILGNAAVVTAAIWRSRRTLPPARTSWRQWRLAAAYLGAFGLPLLLHHFSYFSKGQLDRVLIYRYYGADDLGLYAAAYQLASILGVILMALNKAVVPYYYQALKQRRADALQVRRWALWALCLSPVAPLILYLLPESLLLWFLGDAYRGVQTYAVVFVWGFALTLPYFILCNYLFYFGKNAHIATASIVSAAIYLLVLLCLLPWGLAWLPWAMVSANCVILPLLWRQIKPPTKHS